MTTEVAAKVGISYRQLDHWITRGYIPGVVSQNGSGFPRELNKKQLEHVQVMAELVRAGVKPDYATQYAEVLAEGKMAFTEQIIIARRRTKK